MRSLLVLAAARQAAGKSPPARPDAYSYSTPAPTLTQNYVIRSSATRQAGMREIWSNGVLIQDQNFTITCDDGDRGTSYQTGWEGSSGPSGAAPRRLCCLGERHEMGRPSTPTKV